MKRKTLFSRKTEPTEKPAQIVRLPGLAAPLELKRKRRLRRMSLRISPRTGMIKVAAPLGASEAQIERFVMRHRDWVHAHLDALPEHRPFADGATIPILGIPHRIRHLRSHRGAPLVTDTRELIIGGEPEHLARRVRDYLVERARAEIAVKTRHYASRLNRTVRKISMRDTQSRWGSCGNRGSLCFSWRLIMAPAQVLEYVVAHEVSHLIEMNHSPAFWRIVDSLVPDMEKAKRWLKGDQGAQLLRYG